ncbi:MAG TPA: hypothetical protein VIQ25_07415 [Gemmatimonadales bacterium]|jgi:hypothetical protein
MRFSRPVLITLTTALVGAAAPVDIPRPDTTVSGAALSALPPRVVADSPAVDPKLASGLGLSVYPSKGQTKDQQAKDEKECYQWAGEQTGIDPNVQVNADSAGKAAAAKADSAATGAAVGGAARGAVGGAVVGGIVGDAGDGAAVGAVAGGVKGRKARKQAEAQAGQQGKQAAQAANAESRKTFAKSMATCLQGRGYAVN